MANDDRQSEHFIREVDEEMRRAQLKSIWDRFAPLIIGVCLLVVLLTAGYRGWLWWQERQAAQSGDRFMSAIESLQGANRAEGEAALAAIAAEGGAGYPALARLRLAGEQAAAGQKVEALAAYDALAGDTSVPASFRGLATIRAALLALDAGDLPGAAQRAAPLNESGNSWRHSAREVLGIAAYQGGDLQQARDTFSQIQQDAETPPDLWVRSGMMVALIDGQTPAPGAQPQPGAPPAEPDQAAPAAAVVPTDEAPAGDFGAVQPPPLAEELPPPAAGPLPLSPEVPAADRPETVPNSPAPEPALPSAAPGSSPPVAAAPPPTLPPLSPSPTSPPRPVSPPGPVAPRPLPAPPVPAPPVDAVPPAPKVPELPAPPAIPPQ